MPEVAVYIIYSISLGVLILAGTSIYARFRRAIVRIVQLELDKAAALKKLSDAYQEIENHKLSESDEFVKFLSVSRDWAFGFIDEFQKDLETLYKKLDDGTSTEDTIDSFNALKTYLPKETP
tara:strand:- start:14789 stop:15154 length:366 start_codon:yes stop_codon:yes gene_type:complete